MTTKNTLRKSALLPIILITSIVIAYFYTKKKIATFIDNLRFNFKGIPSMTIQNGTLVVVPEIEVRNPSPINVTIENILIDIYAIDQNKNVVSTIFSSVPTGQVLHIAPQSNSNFRPSLSMPLLANALSLVSLLTTFRGFRVEIQPVVGGIALTKISQDYPIDPSFIKSFFQRK